MKILIVDDEVRGLETLVRILEDDFDIMTAATISETVCAGTNHS